MDLKLYHTILNTPGTHMVETVVEMNQPTNYIPFSDIAALMIIILIVSVSHYLDGLFCGN